MNQHFLVEIGTEELPPKALSQLIESFKAGVVSGLEALQFSHGNVNAYATPRRLALVIESLSSVGEARSIEKRGPIKSAALTASGDPTPAALGFAKTCGLDFSALTWLKTEKGEYLAYQGKEPGALLENIIEGVVERALDSLPIPKLMRWGAHAFSFVRPVLSVVLLHGDRVISGELFGVKSGRVSSGHRIHHPALVSIPSAEAYVSTLKKAFVLVDPKERASLIVDRMNDLAKRHEARVVFDEALLEEVNAIVEWPVPLVCRFDQSFLSVPKEALISAMQGHQKCFALEDASGQLLPLFITVANLESLDPNAVVAGNERVMRARLSDAAFFYEKDLKHRLEDFLPRLEKVTFQAQLGSVGDKVRRVVSLVKAMGGDASAQRAAELSKADLMSEMVYEFPELQGIMGEYYARAQGEKLEVAQALREQYLPRFSGDELPQTLAGKMVALADRIDTLMGIFSIGLKPTGSKDPFALRRAMIGVIRLLTEGGVSCDLWGLFERAKENYPKAGSLEELKIFALDRLKNVWVEEKGYDLIWVEGWLRRIRDAKTVMLGEIESRLHALVDFSHQKEAESLLASVKRVGQLFKKSAAESTSTGVGVNPALFKEAAEQALWDCWKKHEPILTAHRKTEDYAGYLEALTAFSAPLATFFEAVMIMDEDLLIRSNRLALLATLAEAFDEMGMII
jgi:glycyl-tRNA synthetase beta chain